MNKPALYRRVNDSQRRDVSDFSDEFVDEIGKMSGRCLDVGSGPGDAVVDFILPKLNEKASLVCSDISENMVNFGKKKYKDNERLTFIKLNIESPDLPKHLIKQFDHVTSTYCLHWCQDMRQAFRNIFNLLRPGGTTLVTFVANCPGLNAYKKLAAMPRYQPYMKDVDRYIPVFQHSEQPQKALKALIKDVGFEVHHCSIREKSYTFDSPDVLSKCIRAVNPFVERIPADLTEDFEKDLIHDFARLSITFNTGIKNEDEYSTLCIYHIFIAYLKKPIGTDDN